MSKLTTIFIFYFETHGILTHYKYYPQKISLLRRKLLGLFTLENCLFYQELIEYPSILSHFLLYLVMLNKKIKMVYESQTIFSINKSRQVRDKFSFSITITTNKLWFQYHVWRPIKKNARQSTKFQKIWSSWKLIHEYFTKKSFSLRLFQTPWKLKLVPWINA